MTTTIIFLTGLGIGTIAGFIAAALLSRSIVKAVPSPVTVDDRHARGCVRRYLASETGKPDTDEQAANCSCHTAGIGGHYPLRRYDAPDEAARMRGGERL